MTNKMNKTMSTLAVTTTNPLWSYNKSTLKNNLRRYFKDEDIINITVTTADGEEYLSYKSDWDLGKIITKSQDIKRDDRVIGKIQVDFTPYYLNQDLNKMISGIRRRVIGTLTFIFIGIITVIILITKNVTEPLINLSQQMSNFSLGERVDANNEDTGIEEIEEIKHSYFNMAEEINASYEQLEAYNQEITAMNEELSEAVKETKELNQRFDKMIDLISNLVLASQKEDNEFLSNLLHAAVATLPEVDTGTVYKYEAGAVKFVDAIGHDLDKLQQLDIPADRFYNNEQDIEIINMEEMEMIDDQFIDRDIFTSFYDVLEPVRETIHFDLTINGTKKAGISIDIAADKEKSFSSDSIVLFTTFHNIATSFFKLEEYNNLQNQFTKELISSIVKVLEVYDEYTSGHSENVAEMAEEIAQEMDLSSKQVKDSYWAGMVHDIGKLLVPLEILNKEERLTDEEYETIKNHPQWGYKALRKSETLNHIADYVLFHHERWDGGGYPEGMAEDDIPLVAQILTVADAWDAMTSTRSYRDPLTKEKALQEIKENKGTQFSPQVVDAFLKIINSQNINKGA
ncbi:MAG: HD-GYP domain-containing protein [Halanaerobacter sp.]